jgi:type IV pilus assembly protein PilY1
MLFEDIASRIASGASVSVNGEELGSDTTLYQAVYSSDTWTGDIYAYPMDPDTGEILRTESDLKWKASGKAGSPHGLQVLDWDEDRKIITYNTVQDENGSGVPFRLGSLSDEQKTALDSGWATDPTVAGKMVEYLRGNEIVGFRPRTRKLGDIVHSAPLLSGRAVYSGANDGMLHAFDKDTGREIFAYIPNLVFANLSQLADLNYTHQFYVDSTAATNYQGKINADTQNILVCGLGKGGKGYFALDITHVGGFTEDTTESEIASEVVLWEFPDALTASGDINDMGFSFSAAHIVKSAMLVDGKPRWVVIFGNGYNSYNGHAVLFIVDALDGTVVKKIDTGVGDGNGLSSPAVIDVNNDFIADYVYAGDLKGNLWKFDLTDSSPANWVVAYKEGTTPKPLFQATSQPITSRPDVMWHPKHHGFLVIFGTGIYLDNSHRSDVSQQTVYGIWDYGDDEDDSEYLGTLNHTTGALTYPSGISLVKQSVIHTTSIYGDFYRTLSNLKVQWNEEINGIDQALPADHNPADLLDQKPDPVIHAGWFFDFPNTGDYEGERVIKDVTIRGGMVFVLSFIPNSSPCSGGGNSFFYILDPATGGRIETAVMDVNGDGKIDSNDLINIGTEEDPIYASPTGKLNIGMLHAPKFVKITDKLDKVIMSDSSGDIPVEDIEGESLGMYYWIER